MQNYTRKSGEDAQLHSKRVEKIEKTPKTSVRLTVLSMAESIFVEDLQQMKKSDHLKAPEFSTRFECSFKSSPPGSSVNVHLLHSFRVWFYIFSTHFECGFFQHFSTLFPRVAPL
jgi:hypothetical protein